MMVRSTSHLRGRPQRGVTLIEVLVAMLVVSFGVLAVSGLMAAAARTGKTSEYRALATLLAADMTDRMRANKPAVKFGNYEMVDSYEVLTEPPAEAADCAIKNECTELELANIDKAEWERAIYFALPGGRGYVTFNAPDESADIWVAWLDPDAVKNEAKAGDEKGAHQECPPPFQTSGSTNDPQPRCMYFRVGM